MNFQKAQNLTLISVNLHNLHTFNFFINVQLYALKYHLRLLIASAFPPSSPLLAPNSIDPIYVPITLAVRM